MTELLFTGEAVTLEIVGTTLAGAVIVKLWVDVPSEFPEASNVSSVAEAAPLVADGIALSHVNGIA